MTHVVSLLKNTRPSFDGLGGFNKIVHFVPTRGYDHNKFEEVVLVLSEVGTNEEGNLIDKIYLQGPRKVNYTTHKLITNDTLDLKVIIQNKLDELNYEQVTFGDTNPSIVRSGVTIDEAIEVTTVENRGEDQGARYFSGSEVLQILEENDNGEAYITHKQAADLRCCDMVVMPRTRKVIEVMGVSKLITSAMCIILFVRDKDNKANSEKKWLRPEDYRRKKDLDQVDGYIYQSLIVKDFV